MSNFLDLIERYKFGLIAALATYIGIFMYLQMDSYTAYFPIKPFHDGSYVDIPKDDISLDKENIEIPDNYQPGDMKNMVSDANDDRKSSMTDYSDRRSSKDVENDVRNLEKQFYNDAGGDAERKKIQEQMDARKNDPKQTSTNPNNTSQSGSDNKYGGNTMVDFSLTSRNPFQNNTWYVRNPGYTCGYGSGVIVVDIKVNQNGNVISAELNAGKSSGGNECMINKALEYAKKSRFNYSGSAPKTQSGWIKYTFVSQ